MISVCVYDALLLYIIVVRNKLMQLDISRLFTIKRILRCWGYFFLSFLILREFLMESVQIRRAVLSDRQEICGRHCAIHLQTTVRNEQELLDQVVLNILKFVIYNTDKKVKHII